MISGVSSSSAYSLSFVTRVQPSRVERPQPLEIRPERQPEELVAPSGTEQTLAREYTMLDLATRQFGRILPAIETLSAPVD